MIAKIWLLFWLLVGIPYATAQPQPATHESGDVETLTLEKCIEIAISSATQILKLKNDVEISGSQLVQAYGQFLPNLVGTAGYSQQTGHYITITGTPSIVQSTDYGGNYQLASSINLFNGLADSAGLHAAIERKTAILQSLTRAHQQIALDVAQAFLQTVYDERLIEISKENLNVSQAREALLEARAKVGLSDLSDLYRQQALTSQDEASVIIVTNRQHTDLLSLLKRLRLDAQRRYQLASPTINEARDTDAPKNEDDLVNAALKYRPDLKAGEHSLTAFREDLNVAKSTYLPRLDFGAALAGSSRHLDAHVVNDVYEVPSSQKSIASQLESQVLYSVGLTLTWNIFDRDLTKANVERASVAIKNVEIDNEDLRNSIVVEAKQAYSDYVSAKSQFIAEDKGLIAAQKAYDVIKGKYNVGSAKFLDLADAQATLVRAKAARIQALIGLELQKRALKTVTGSSK